MTYRKSTLLLLAALALWAATASIARADESATLELKAIESKANLFGILAQRGISSALHGKDLTAAWRMLRVIRNSEASAVFNRMSGQNPNAVSGQDLYYTRGDMITVLAQNYLVAYQIVPPSDPQERLRQERFQRAWQDQNDGDSVMTTRVEVPPLDESTPLSLSLIAMGEGVSLADIRAFDPDKDLITPEGKARRKVQIERTISQSNLKQVALGVMQYVQDYDEMLPPMRAARTAEEFSGPALSASAATAPVQVMIMPYVKSTQVFLHPGTGRPYLPNYKISRKTLSQFASPAETFLFFEDAPDAGGMRNIAFLDGHVKAFKEADFQRMRQAQGISQSGFPLAGAIKAQPKSKPQINQRRTNAPGAPPGVR